MRVSLVVLVTFVISTAVGSDFDCDPELHQKDETRAIFLDTHNELRRNIALGKQENKVGFLASAKNMYELEWDCDLEVQAQYIVDSCSLDGKVGAAQNNIALSGGNFLPDSILVALAMNNWMSTIKFFGKRDPTNEYDGFHCQFANMVHANTTQLGCAFKHCGDNFLLTCLYDKCASKEKLMWETGTACKENKDCTTFPNSTCSNSLCARQPLWWIE